MSINKFEYQKALRGLPMKPQLVARVLADYADEHGRKAHPGIARLAADCCMPESTVRKHLGWLQKNGYVVQESRGHNAGDVALASVYSLTLPDLLLTGERKPTAHSEVPTAHSEPTYRSPRADLPLTSEHLPDPLTPDPLTPDQKTSDQESHYVSNAPVREPVSPLSGPDTIEDCYGCRLWGRQGCSVHAPTRTLVTVGAPADDDEPPFGNEPIHYDDAEPPF